LIGAGDAGRICRFLLILLALLRLLLQAHALEIVDDDNINACIDYLAQGLLTLLYLLSLRTELGITEVETF
jgi:hypothetical protein